METTIREIIKCLYINNSELNLNDSISLFSGLSGSTLFEMLYVEQFRKDNLTVQIQEKLQKIGEESFSYLDKTICNGKSGINWLFNYLCNNEFIDEESRDIVCSDNDVLAAHALKYIRLGKYDYLHGSLGIAYYLLYDPNFVDDVFFESIFFELAAINNLYGGRIPRWDFELQKFDTESTDLGLAHGLSSILKFCIQSYKQNVCVKEAEVLAKKIVYYLVSINRADFSRSYYPSIYKPDENAHFDSRLAWCYGDLSLAFVLYQYSQCFGDKNVAEFSLDILRKTTFRKRIDNTKVNDVGICHGSAGIAHIYNKLWYYTHEKIFKDACEFWIMDIINVWKEGDGKIYKKYNPSKHHYELSTSLLEGTTGVGLVLLSYLSGNFNWDYCLMLND